jgi:hypothetical protein
MKASSLYFCSSDIKRYFLLPYIENIRYYRSTEGLLGVKHTQRASVEYATTKLLTKDGSSGYISGVPFTGIFCYLTLLNSDYLVLQDFPSINLLSIWISSNAVIFQYPG